MFVTSCTSTRAFAPRTTLSASHRRSVRVYAAAGPINPGIKKDEAKVVDTADVSAQEKPQVAYCRCWRSKTFPLCDGALRSFKSMLLSLRARTVCR